MRCPSAPARPVLPHKTLHTRRDDATTQGDPSNALAYNPALDGLRGVAILLVVLSHAHAPLFDGAFYGVDLFFVLSGFLITTLLLKELQSTGRLDYWRFYRRRLWRLTPALALLLLAYCVFAPMLWPGLNDVYSDALVSLLYLADYGIAFFDSPATLLHMWSLSVEEHFYLVWPPLLVVLARITPRGRLWSRVAVLLLLAWAWRLLWVLAGQQFYEIFFRFDTRATGLLTGSMLAALVLERPAWFTALCRHLTHFMWLVLAVPLLMAQAWDDMNAMAWGMTVVEGATVVVLLALLQRRGAVYEMLSAAPLVWLGKLSYGIYLWHYPVVRYLRADLPWPMVVLLGLFISTALAALSYYSIERWALRRRDARPVPHAAPAPKARPRGPTNAGPTLPAHHGR
ncbi:MAG: acyltransferase [Proteobacteria bacterium]|nr:acyltransferase [Pseudomonadota bacterium]